MKRGDKSFMGAETLLHCFQNMINMIVLETGLWNLHWGWPNCTRTIPQVLFARWPKITQPRLTEPNAKPAQTHEIRVLMPRFRPQRLPPDIHFDNHFEFTSPDAHRFRELNPTILCLATERDRTKRARSGWSAGIRTEPEAGGRIRLWDRSGREARWGVSVSVTDLRGRGGESEVGGDGERLRHAAQPLGRLRLRRRHGVAGAEVVYNYKGCRRGGGGGDHQERLARELGRASLSLGRLSRRALIWFLNLQMAAPPKRAAHLFAIRNTLIDWIIFIAHMVISLNCLMSIWLERFENFDVLFSLGADEFVWGLSSEFVSHSAVFFSHNKLANNTFCHGLSAK